MPYLMLSFWALNYIKLTLKPIGMEIGSYGFRITKCVMHNAQRDMRNYVKVHVALHDKVRT